MMQEPFGFLVMRQNSWALENTRTREPLRRPVREQDLGHVLVTGPSMGSTTSAATVEPTPRSFLPYSWLFSSISSHSSPTRWAYAARQMRHQRQFLPSGLPRAQDPHKAAATHHRPVAGTSGIAKPTARASAESRRQGPNEGDKIGCPPHAAALGDHESPARATDAAPESGGAQRKVRQPGNTERPQLGAPTPSDSNARRLGGLAFAPIVRGPRRCSAPIARSPRQCSTAIRRS